MDTLVQSFRRVIWQYLCIYTLMAKSEEELKSLLMRVKQESEKAGLKPSPPKKEKKDHGIWFHQFVAKRRGKSRSSKSFYFIGFQNHCR